MKKLLMAVLAGVAALVAAPLAAADGTETLGPPSVPIQPGTNYVVAGVGMHAFPGTPNTLNVSVPAGASVKQVLLYWTGHHSSPNASAGDDTISVNGAPVTGTLIGGPTGFFSQNQGASEQTETFSTYRADITSRGVVGPGSNTLLVSDLQYASSFFGSGNDGVGVIVIYDNGGDSEVVGIRDGQDLAYKFFAPPLNTTVPQTFTFSPAPTARPGNLGTLAGSVKGPDSAKHRGNILRVTFDVGGSVDIVDPWQSNQQAEFDALKSAVTIPANATTMTVQALSEGPNDDNNQPASFSWINATLEIQNPPRPGADGCTPGYWKNHDGSKKQTNQWAATPYSPSTPLSSVFSTGSETPAGTTMRQALDWGGGSSLDAKKRLLLHHAVAAVLNAAHPSVSYPMTAAQIISAVNAALASNDATTIENLKNQLDRQNNGGCPIGN